MQHTRDLDVVLERLERLPRDGLEESRGGIEMELFRVDAERCVVVRERVREEATTDAASVARARVDAQRVPGGVARQVREVTSPRQ